MLASVQQVECTNCGGDSWATVLGIAIAVVALVVSLVALYIARKQLEIDERQHGEFMRQINARAEFQLELSFPEADRQHRIETDATTTNVRLAIRLSNSGGKRAGPTVLNVIIPNLVTEAYWTDANGALVSGSMGPARTLERLTDASGEEWSCKFLTLELPHVSTRSPVMKFVTVHVHTADVGEAGISVPFRATAEADELDGDEASTRAMLHLVRKPQP